MNILFIYNHEYPDLWQDGLYAALELLSREFTVNRMNLNTWHGEPPLDGVDFVLGWGAFGSPVDTHLRKPIYDALPKGLCIAGNVVQPFGLDNYKVLFYETEWYRPQISSHPNIVHAFGVNKHIYSPDYRTDTFKAIDVLSVGAFALWKRHHKIIEQPGDVKLVIGEIQKGNPHESSQIIGELMGEGVIISDMVKPESLARLYNASHLAYIPASIEGGGERAVLEARACGIKVKVSQDNPKLQELTNCPVWDENYYRTKLREGILSCF